MTFSPNSEEQDIILESNKKMTSKKNVTLSKTCILVLGMQGAGGSTLSRVFNMLGCDLPTSIVRDANNEAENEYRSYILRDFNETLLTAAGSAWDDLTPFNRQWLSLPTARPFLERAAELLANEFGNSQLFVLEDSRNCHLAAFWFEALRQFNCAVKPVLVTRNPVELSNSLHTEPGHTEAYRQIIWLRHMLDAETQTRGMTRLCTSFNQLIDHWDIIAQGAQKKLDLSWPRPIASMEFEIRRCLEQLHELPFEKTGSTIESPLVAEWVRESYTIFDRWARDGEDSADYEALDRIKTQFDAGSQAFARLVRAERDQSLNFRAGMETLSVSQKERDLAMTLLAEKELECAELIQELQEHKRQTTLLNAELIRQRDELAIFAQLAARNEDRAVQMNTDKDELKVKLYREREQNEILTQQIDRMCRMFSWRITAPLRKSGRLWRRFTRKSH